jgi:hypothetical protein
MMGWNWSDAMACGVEVFTRPKSPIGNQDVETLASKCKA